MAAFLVWVTSDSQANIVTWYFIFSPQTFVFGTSQLHWLKNCLRPESDNAGIRIVTWEIAFYRLPWKSSYPVHLNSKRCLELPSASSVSDFNFSAVCFCSGSLCFFYPRVVKHSELQLQCCKVLWLLLQYLPIIECDSSNHLGAWQGYCITKPLKLVALLDLPDSTLLITEFAN